jgi:hypothetical protein
VKLPEPFTFFVDRSLGRGIVVDELRAAGEIVEPHDEHFAPNTPTLIGSRKLAGVVGWY